MEPLFDRQGWPSTEIRALAAEMDDAMGWDRHFIRLNSRSPKDAPWPFEVPATCSAKEAIGILACSERVLEDTCLFHFIPEHPAFICLREFIPGLRTDSEFRCFVKNGELIAVTHYDYHNPIPAPKDGGKAIREHIEAWFLSTLRPRLHLQTVVFDVWLDWRGELLLIELNPYGLSDPCWLGGYDAVESFSGFVAFAPVQPDSEPADERSEVTSMMARNASTRRRLGRPYLPSPPHPEEMEREIRRVPGTYAQHQERLAGTPIAPLTPDRRQRGRRD
jgi:hypothetical protein